jgi:hypothetical protein
MGWGLGGEETTMPQREGPTTDQINALDQLVQGGTLTNDQGLAVRAALWHDEPAGLRPGNPAAVLIEVAGYVGGALMVGGAGLLVTLQRSQLGRQGVTTTLAGYTLALLIAAVLVAGGPHRIAGLRDGRSPVRRRLVGVLLAFSSGPAALATAIAVDHRPALPAGPAGRAGRPRLRRACLRTAADRAGNPGHDRHQRRRRWGCAEL